MFVRLRLAHAFNLVRKAYCDWLFDIIEEGPRIIKNIGEQMAGKTNKKNQWNWVLGADREKVFRMMRLNWLKKTSRWVPIMRRTRTSDEFSSWLLILLILVQVVLSVGRIIEIYMVQNHQQGKTTVALHAVAQAQRRWNCSLYRCGNTLDPAYVAALGVDTALVTTRLRWASLR